MTEVSAPDRRPVRLLTAGYIIALTIIAGMSMCIHVFLDQVIAEQNNSVIAVSARQAKFSQRAALYASKYVHEPSQVNAQAFDETLEQMRLTHARLVADVREMDTDSNFGEMAHEIFFLIPYKLDLRMKDFFEQSKLLLEVPPDQLNPENRHYVYIMEATDGPLLAALDAALIAFESDSNSRIIRLQSYQLLALFVIFATLVGEAFLIFRPLVKRVDTYAAQLEKLAHTDGLTGIDNYRSFMQKGVRELRRALRLGKPLCVCMLDLDHFKSINDQYGHHVGDLVLKRFSELVEQAKRIEDEFGRLGGEEFGVLLPHTKLSGALVVAERIRKTVETTPIRYNETDDLFITVSIGLAEANPKAHNLDSVINCADEALYRAKRNGRNRVEISRKFTTEDNVVSLEQAAESAE